jgi:hypothetical protein
MAQWTNDYGTKLGRVEAGVSDLVERRHAVKACVFIINDGNVMYVICCWPASL